jgi:polyribonucleotide nucleotidyltransferase
MTRPIGAHDLTMQTGKLAKLADGAVVVTYGQTQVIATCVRSKPREGIDFFPLTIDVEERAYAAGKIPGSFFRREGRPGETAILTARLIDRPLRPTFKEGFRDEVQVVVTVLSVDMENPYDIPAMNAAACAVGLAGLPFDGPVAAVRLGLINGEWVVNPTYQETEDATFDIVVAGSKSDDGGVDVLMIEGEAPVHTWSLLAEGALAPTEEVVAQGLEVAKTEIAKLIAFQDEFIAAHGVSEMEWTPTPQYGDDLWDELYANSRASSRAAIVPDHRARRAFSAVREAKAHWRRRWVRTVRRTAAGSVHGSPQKKVMRRRGRQGVRLDGRSATEIRPVSRGRRLATGTRVARRRGDTRC